MTREEQWQPVKLAAAAANVPVRTVFRWVAKRIVPSCVDGKITVVDVAALKAHVSGRAVVEDAVPEPPVASARAEESETQMDEPEESVAVKVIGLLEAGRSPTAIVCELEVAPSSVQAVHRQWLALRSLSTNAPDGAKRLQELESKMAAMRASYDALVRAHNDLVARFTNLGTIVAGLPWPGCQSFECAECHAKGFPVAPVRCGACNALTEYGFWPEKRR